MLNRLMFIYFIQKKGFLNDDPDYLSTKLAESKQRGKDRYYRDSLCPLFFEGFAKREQDRSPQARELLGNVPYLNGGIFQRHQVEELHGETIRIPDRAFEKLFAFFEQYQWHLDERPLRDDNEINPDVLGYIFEKYINQKQMGAYYTKEDITGYISQNTVIPRLFDMAREKCKVAFEGEHSVWQLLQEDPDRYIYDAVKKGVIDAEGEVVPESDLLDFVQAGMHDPKVRMFDKRYNLGQAPKDDPLRLPTETWREYVARRQRCLDLRGNLAAGEVRAINDLITLNLDIRQFAQDAVQHCEGPELLVAFWRSIAGWIPDRSNQEMVQGITVLDPACGSGAFLFAALNILEPLYDACLDRMEFLLAEWGETAKKNHPNYHKLFSETLKRVEEHPNRPYFIFKSIVVNNLYGVDIMDEAVEICKLRLFLKLVAQVDSVEHLEPLPDIDFNIRTGNTLVGFASLDGVRKTISGLGWGEQEREIARIEEDAQAADKVFQQFHRQQTAIGGTVTAKDKADLSERLKSLADRLDRYLAGEYGIDVAEEPMAFAKWRHSHKPFHWFTEFYGIVHAGGFAVIIGNPPYVNPSKVRGEYTVKGFVTERCPDIYAWVLERVSHLTSGQGRSGMICPLSLGFSDSFKPCRRMLLARYPENWFSSFGRIPSALFSFDVRVRNTIHIGDRAAPEAASHTTRLHRWFDQERPALFPSMSYADFTPALWRGRIPKLNTTRLGQAFERCLSKQANCLGHMLHERRTKNGLYFKKTAYNWLNFCRRLPPCYDANGVPIQHTKFGEVFFRDADSRDFAFLLLNGKIEFAFWIVAGDDFDVTKWVFADLPIDPGSLPPRAKARLLPVVAQLESAMKEAVSFKMNAGKKVGNFNLAKCRHVTDLSDVVFAKHFGFADVWEDIELLYSQVVRTEFDSAEG